MPELGVNIDHVATIREARKIDYPDPVKAAVLCQKAGADSIVCHLREDRRHIQDEDLYRLKKTIRIKLNLEMAMSKEIIDIALRVKPDQITLVPEKRKELTTEGGLNVVSQKNKIKKVVNKMRKRGIETSLFIDPDIKQIKAAKYTTSPMIELHTGCYADAKSVSKRKKEYKALEESAKLGEKLGLMVFAGHGLNYKNTRPLTKIKEIKEYNIGHSIVARSCFVGIGEAVKGMKRLVR